MAYNATRADDKLVAFESLIHNTPSFSRTGSNRWDSPPKVAMIVVGKIVLYMRIQIYSQKQRMHTGLWFVIRVIIKTKQLSQQLNQQQLLPYLHGQS